MDVQVLLSFMFLTIFFSTGNAAGKPDPYAGKVEIMLLNGGHQTIWPGVHTKTGHQIVPTGFKLEPRDIYHIKVPDSWSGTIWARTGCSGNPNTTFHCDVGDCGTHNIHCHQSLPKPPATLLKFNLAPKGGTSSYKIDLRYGFNIPATLSTFTSKCKEINWVRDIRSDCPDWLAVYSHEGRKIGCKSACYTTGESKHCCTGAFASPQKCELNEYTQLVENNCPDSVSNAFDDTHFTCHGGASFQITFWAW
ncbi:thaumatin-like protein 1b [Lotus japonicus]|uniref:thaumatin-like protein 1b n=1 Tax=Lotus japonicus TaxID=34305 RepID=UPI00258B879B|nr:thaumatin-like protein 1b [Lotus japonicus]